MERSELEKSAKELDVSFDEKTSEEDLIKLVDDKKQQGEKESDVDYWKSEAKKIIEQRDNAKKDKNTLKRKVDELEGKLKSSIDFSAHDTLKSELDGLKTYKTTVEKEKEEAELAKLDEVERLKIRAVKEKEEFEKRLVDERTKATSNIQKQLDELKEEFSDSLKQVESLRGSKLESEIIKSAKNAIEPSHVFKLLKSDFEYDPSLGKFIHSVRDSKNKITDEIGVDEYVKNFLGKKENDYLVRSDANRSSLHTRSTTADQTIHTKIGDYDPKDPNLIADAQRKHLKIEDYMKILKLKDEKMKKIEEKRKQSK